METLRFGATLLLELVPLFVLISTLVYLAVDTLTPERMQRLLGSTSSLRGIPLATALGALTPFCSCSTVPIANGMLRGGVPTPSLVAFLIASPLVSPVAVALLWSTLGASYALLYAGLAMLLAGVGGALVGGRLEAPRQALAVIQNLPGASCGCAAEPATPSWRRRALDAFARSLGDLRKLALPLLAAVAIGAAIHGFAPTDLLVRLAGPDSLWAVPLAALVGVPIYASVVIVVPLAAGLLGKGVGIGAVTAFLMASSGFSIPEGILLSRILPGRLLVRIVVVFTAGVVLIGYLFHLLPRLA